MLKMTWDDTYGGFTIGLAPNTHLSGKITLPISVKGMKNEVLITAPVVGISSEGFMASETILSGNITHIFWEKGDNQVKIIKSQGFR
jgi:hypothetical protein